MFCFVLNAFVSSLIHDLLTYFAYPYWEAKRLMKILCPEVGALATENGVKLFYVRKWSAVIEGLNTDYPTRLLEILSKH
jgi:hypothetical protein